MIELVKFILATSGLVMILNISKLFRPLREKISLWDLKNIKKRSINAMANVSDEQFPNWVQKAIKEKVHKNKKNYLSWFLNSIFSCSLCMGVWAGLFIFGLKYIPYGYGDIISYMCIGACSSLLLVTFYQFLEKK